MKYLKSAFLIFVVLGLLNNISVNAVNAEADQANTTDDYEDHPLCPCPRIYRPVCGSNNVTYGNECEFLCAASSEFGKKINLMMARKGSCSELKDRNAL